MRFQQSAPLIAFDSENAAREAILQRFKVDEIQHLNRDELLFAQSLAGHGDVWGLWQTPKSISPKLSNHARRIDLTKRLRDFVIKDSVSGVVHEALVEEGVVQLTRLALITRLVGTGKGHGKVSRLKPSSIACFLNHCWPMMAARAVCRKAENQALNGLFSCLTENDVLEFNALKRSRVELGRLDTLVSRAVWCDVPIRPNVALTTAPSGKRNAFVSEEKVVPHPPIPDDYMAAIGPRVLWVIQQMGPCLLRLLEALPDFQRTVDWSLTNVAIGKRMQRFISGYLKKHPWLDDSGRPLIPPFPLTTGFVSRGGRNVNPQEWPPRTREQISILSQTLQSAHLFITLLACAGRIGEVESLERDCVSIERDAQEYLRGYTYKLSGNLFGDAREWPAPDLLRQCLGQQACLAAAWDWLPRSLGDQGPPQSPRFGNALWVSLGGTGKAGKEGATLTVTVALMNLASRLGMDPKPGGKNLHAHRFRKTIGRLAGIALFNSPLVLKRLFGHKSIEMTLHYILCDRSIREEAEAVLRELRIMHCAEALEEIHHSLLNGLPLPGNGGSGAAVLVNAVANEAKHLAQSCRIWGEGTAYELAYLLTAQGKAWRLIKENIICSKAPGEPGMCRTTRAKGEPDTANCKPDCQNRIVLARQRRDTELIIDQYLDLARKSRDDNQLLVLSSVMANLSEELEKFADLKEKYLCNPEIQSFFALCNQSEEDLQSRQSNE